MNLWVDVVFVVLEQTTEPDQCLSPDCFRAECDQSNLGPQLTDVMTLTLARHH